MNILFVNYGDFTTNSLNHIGGFANTLCAGGHACVVAVPFGKDTLEPALHPLFIPAAYDEVLERPGLFPDGRGADIVHAWTPREWVREFVVAYQARSPAHLVVHLEDNEVFLLEAYTKRDLSQLAELNANESAAILTGALSHPLRLRNLLRLADAVTVIEGRLREHVPPGPPVHVLHPGVDPIFIKPAVDPAAIRGELGLADHERVVVFTGSTSFANEPEIRDLYLAVAMLNREGVPTRLVRTGTTSPQFRAGLPASVHEVVLDLGRIDKQRLPGLLAIADVLVQPGKPGPFNDFRLPSKLPEFLASGRPVVLPATNIGLMLRDGIDALLLKEGTADEIVFACRRVFSDGQLARSLGERGAAFAAAHFDLRVNTAGLEGLYQSILARPRHAGWEKSGASGVSDVALLASQALAGPEVDLALVRELVPQIRLLEEQLKALTGQQREWKQAQEREALLQQHAANLEKLLEVARTDVALGQRHAANLEENLSKIRDDLAEARTQSAIHQRKSGESDLALRAAQERERLTRDHAANLERILERVRADVAFGQQHAVNLENALAAERERSAQYRVDLALKEREFSEARAALASALEREKSLSTHAANIERMLEQVRADVALGQQHAVNLENALAAERESSAQLRADLARGKLELSEAETALAREIDDRRREAAASARQRAELEARIRAEVDEQVRARTAAEQVRKALDASEEARLALAAQLSAREDKVRRMQSSFSWRVTAPLRALRRLLVDRRREAAAAQADPAHSSTKVPAVVATASGSGMQFRVDEPRTWDGLESTRLTILGWILPETGGAVAAVRVLCGSEVFDGRSGLRRVDVLAAHRDHPLAEFSGFAIDVTLPLAGGSLILEYRNDSDSWLPFFRTTFTVDPDATDAPPNSYQRWMRKNEDHSAGALQRLREESESWLNPPLLSIVMPVYNTPERWLIRAIDSVRDQTYACWELCIADDASTEPHVRPVLERFAADPRIKVAFRESNGHISAASNTALELASGDWIALLDHDDELAPDALHHVAAAVQADPEVDLVYSDEDKIDEAGVRHTPYFKPDYMPELLTSQNFISHLAVYRARVLREIGGFRVGLEGSQDWDLVLRFVDRISAERIRHIPRVLYHWRMIPGSTALLLSEKDYPAQAARRALTDHFARSGESVELHPVPGGHWRARHKLPETAPLVSLIIPTRNGLHLIRRCVESILEKTTYPSYEIIIVDNGSDEPEMLAWLQDLPAATGRGGHASAIRNRDDRLIRILRDDRPFNYSALNNRAVREARGEFVGLINNDLEVITPGWLEEMVSQAARPGVGCVGAMLYYPDDTIQHAGVVLGVGGVAGHAFKRLPRGAEGSFNRARLVQNYSAVTGACLVVRKSTYEQVGGLGEQKLAVAFNDIDFCLKVRAAGYRNVWTPFAELYHHESASRGLEDTPEKHDRFRLEAETMRERWGDLLRRDPAYNPNLSLESEDFSIATKSRL